MFGYCMFTLWSHGISPVQVPSWLCSHKLAYIENEELCEGSGATVKCWKCVLLSIAFSWDRTNLPTGKTVSGDTHCFAFRYSGSLFPAIARGCWLLVDIVKCFSTKCTVSLKGNSSMCGMCGAELFCTLHTNSWRHFWQVTMIDFCCTFCEGFYLYFARLGSAISVSDTLSSDKAGVLETSGGAWLARTDRRRWDTPRAEDIRCQIAKERNTNYLVSDGNGHWNSHRQDGGCGERTSQKNRQTLWV